MPRRITLSPNKLLMGFYLLIHTLLCLVLLYLFTEGLPKPHANPRIAFALFIIANLFFAIVMLSPRFSLRILWATLSFTALYILLQGIGDYFATQDSAPTMAILYNILQLRMSLLLSLLFLCSTVLGLRFGKYRSFEAILLLSASFFLLTQDELSMSFESRYWLYRLFWLSLPLLSLSLLGLSLHPILSKDHTFLPYQNHKFSALPRRLIYFCLLLALLFLVLWLTKISPINWNQSSHSSNSGNGLLQKNLSNQFDFGEYLQLDSSLEQDRQLVMMAKLENIREDRPTYLTRFTLGGIDDKRSFFRDPKEPNMSGESPLPLELERGTSVFEMPQYDLRQSKQMDVFLLNINPSSLFVLNYPTQVQTYENWPDSSFSRVYRVDARTLTEFFPFGEVLSDYPVSLERMAYYTKVPERYRDIGEFALQILQEQRGEGFLPAEQMPLELAQIFTEYFHREYRYTLKPGIAEDGDQLRYFLYQGKKGYCTYFAFSAGLMLRSLGIPTRIAVGFLLNPQLRILDYYPLFADQAHAWIEVYDPQQGWVTFDPTTFELAPGEELEFGLPEGAEADLAALTEELLRNDLLNTENGLNQLTPEQSTNLLANILETFRSQAWLLPTIILLLFMLGLLAFRLYLGHWALRARLSTQTIDRASTAMYYYLLLLNGELLSRTRQISSWKALLEELCRDSDQAPQRYKGSLACLRLLQKYYFAPRFHTEDMAALRRELVQLKSRHKWNVIFIMKVFFLFFFTSKNVRSWSRNY